MSIVLVCATPKKVVIKSDGRSKRDGTIVSEDIRKFTQFDNSCVLAYTGHLEFCELIVKDIQNNIESNLFASLDTILTIIQTRYSVGVFHPSDFCIAGKHQRKIYVKTIAPPYLQWVDRSPVIDRSVVVTRMGDLALQAHPFSTSFFTFEKDMDKHIREMSKIIDSINDHIFTATIIK